MRSMPKGHADRAFGGAKIALHDDRFLLTYLRDARDGLPFPGQWDLPGGGREGRESPVECALREVEEEFALRLDASCINYARCYASGDRDITATWFLAGRIHAEDVRLIRFGDEGQEWRMMAIEEFLGRSDAVAPMQQRLRDYLDSQSDRSPA